MKKIIIILIKAIIDMFCEINRNIISINKSLATITRQDGLFLRVTAIRYPWSSRNRMYLPTYLIFALTYMNMTDRCQSGLRWIFIRDVSKIFG